MHPDRSLGHCARSKNKPPASDKPPLQSVVATICSCTVYIINTNLFVLLLPEVLSCLVLINLYVKFV